MATKINEATIAITPVPSKTYFQETFFKRQSTDTGHKEAIPVFATDRNGSVAEIIA